MPLKSGHQVIPIEGDELERLCKELDRNRSGLIRLQPDGWFLYSAFPSFADKYFEFQFKPSDVIVMTYPKCGTTWMQEIVWTIRNNPSLDHPDALQSIEIRSPFFDCDYMMHTEDTNDEFTEIFRSKYPDRDPKEGIFLQISELSPDPRTIKVHLPFSLLPPNILDVCKVIYVARNPKDTCVSYYHQHKLMKDVLFTGTMDTFVDHFVEDELLNSPYWVHLREAWEKKDHPNLLICFYEEMKEDPRKNLNTINDFLKTNLSEDQIDKVLQHTSFKAMKERDALMGMPNQIPSFMDAEVYKKKGGFFRKGEINDWKNVLTKDQEEKINVWSKKNLEKFSDDFPYQKYF